MDKKPEQIMPVLRKCFGGRTELMLADTLPLLKKMGPQAKEAN